MVLEPHQKEKWKKWKLMDNSKNKSREFSDKHRDI
jgi:hypothetical protein